MPLSKEQKQKINELYYECGNKKEISRQLDIPYNTILKFLKDTDIIPKQTIHKKGQKVVLTDEEIEQINKRYEETLNMAQVAREFGITGAKVKSVLTSENLKLVDKDKEYRDALFYYILNLFGIESEKNPVSEWNITQMQNFKKSGISYRAQLLTLKYYYEVQRNKVKKEHRTIGIIPFIINDAAAYYRLQDKRKKDIEQAIEKQLAQDRITIKYNPSDYIGKRKKKKMIDLNSIVGDEE